MGEFAIFRFLISLLFLIVIMWTMIFDRLWLAKWGILQRTAFSVSNTGILLLFVFQSGTLLDHSFRLNFTLNASHIMLLALTLVWAIAWYSAKWHSGSWIKAVSAIMPLIFTVTLIFYSWEIRESHDKDPTRGVGTLKLNLDSIGP